MAVCAIHQPNFFPWLGYFDKIRRSDVFVFMDNVDYPRKSSTCWTKRVKLNIQGEARWFGCPVDKNTWDGVIKDVCIAGDPKWRSNALKTLEMNYAKARNFEVAMQIVEPLLMNPEQNLADYNIHAITTLAGVLGLDTKLVRQSTLHTPSAATDQLIEICRGVGADTYLAGGGAGGYQEDEKFAQAGLGLVYQSFEPPRYGPDDEYIPGLSVIDYLMKAESVEAFGQASPKDAVSHTP